MEHLTKHTFLTAWVLLLCSGASFSWADAAEPTSTETAAPQSATEEEKKPDDAEDADKEKKEEECKTVCYDESDTCKKGTFHAKVKGGFYSNDPRNIKASRAERTNNPGAINAAGWIRRLSSYVGFQSDGRGNNTAIFDSPEAGVAVYRQLLTNYASRMRGGFTIRNIVLTYAQTNPGLGDYIAFVSRRTGYNPDAILDINNTAQMVPLAKAMFRYESGRESKLSDAQIAAGWNMDLKNGTIDKKSMCDAMGKSGAVVARRDVPGTASPVGGTGGMGGMGGMSGMGGSSDPMSSLMSLLSLMNSNNGSSGTSGGTTNTTNTVDESGTKTVSTVINSDGTRTVKVTKNNGEVLTFVVPANMNLWSCGTTYEVARPEEASKMLSRQCKDLIGPVATP